MKKKIVFSHSLILYLHEVMDVHQPYCDNHLIMYVSQVFMMYTVNLYSAIY